MSIYRTARVAHPVQGHHAAMENRRTICDARGFCGPFVNEAYYDAFPDPMWKGTGECAICCSTCNVERELAKQREIEAIATPIRATPRPNYGNDQVRSASA